MDASYIDIKRKKERKSWQDITLEVVAILLIALFGLTAFDKAIRFERFYSELGKSPFLMNYAFIIAIGTPLVELAVAVALSIDKTRLKGLYASVFLMSLFTAYIYMLVNYSYFTSCLCSAAVESLTWEEHLIFNIIFLILAITGVALQETNQQKQIGL
ncbi:MULTISPECIES: MauE/DoxX family redox-associated membrane protein [Olivibacter]|jgi:uncharacterized membrane protein YphA (DoxX/SURF4 family)|uniref:MauE/DoxX family redox-associated membrane protein n=2 Tax=Olivibacter TaxID=376469 RepID=A0ABV6HQN4_9SPHI|nr:MULTISPECIES: MauE/DoxX family redox-associated membrane protein [Olivibacter]MDX3917450.1 hypothetical protein [Pseudosphingobacterium sp.]QEL03953.1 hypothetical protein FKG96_25005 [Olivibacter sp. LS-1]